MPKATDPKIEARILELYAEGLSPGKIAKAVGIAKSTIQGIIKRASSVKPSDPFDSDERTVNDLRTPAPAIRPASDEPNRSSDEMSGLSQQMIAKDLVTFINAAKRGIVEIRRSNDIKNYRDRSQMEAQWMHLYGLGIKMGIKATGLSAEALVTATEDFEPDITSSLERFNSIHRKEAEEE